MVCFVMLNNFFLPEIVNAHVLVFGAGNNPGLNWMEDSLRDWFVKSVIFLDVLFLRLIPDENLLVLASGTYQVHVRAHFGTGYPISVPHIRTLKLQSVDIPQFYCFVGAPTQNHLSVG